MERQRHGPLRRRPGRTDRTSTERTPSGRPLHRRWRGRPLHRPPRHRPRGQSGADRRRPAAHAEDGGQPRGPADRGLRRDPRRRLDGPLTVLPGPERLRSTAANRSAPKISQGLRDAFWLQGMLVGLKSAYDCIKAFSETDFTEDLKKIDVPTLSSTATTTRSSRSRTPPSCRRSWSRTRPSRSTRVRRTGSPTPPSGRTGSTATCWSSCGCSVRSSAAGWLPVAAGLVVPAQRRWPAA